jgi:hypothetical protein
MAKAPSRAKKARPPKVSIDRSKLRVALEHLSAGSAFAMLVDALDFVPDRELAKLAGRYLDVSQLRPSSRSKKKTLLSEIQAFDAASRAGNYYESFNVNSKNYTQRSQGTRTFVAECNRLLDRCVSQAPKGDAAEIRQALETMFALLRHIRECHDDIIFFADEAGLWQVGVAWAEVLPALFHCLARTCTPEAYARGVLDAVNEFGSFGREEHLAEARRLGSAAQRTALQRLLRDNKPRKP